jgi:hypothetical protein
VMAAGHRPAATARRAAPPQQRSGNTRAVKPQPMPPIIGLRVL